VYGLNRKVLGEFWVGVWIL